MKNYIKNDDLFYNSQLSKDSMCWILKFKGSEVLRGILKDTEINYSIENSYQNESDAALLDIASLMRAGSKLTRTAYTKGPQLQSMIDEAQSILNNASGGSGFAKTVNEGINKVQSGANKLAKEAEDWINKNLQKLAGSGVTLEDEAYGQFISAFDHAKFWEGSSVGIQLPSLNTIIFDEAGDGNTLNAKLKELHDYCMENFNGGGDTSGMWGLLKSPKGYKPDFEKGNLVDPEFEGTFTLELGDRAIIKNLVITNFSSSISQFKRILPGGSVGNSLYAEVSISLDFASFVTKEALNKCLKITGNA